MEDFIFDVGIIGAGAAGATALLRILKEHSDLKIAVFDSGRPPLKRRHQIFGFLGCMPGSDGKLYENDLQKIYDVCGTRKTNSGFKQVFKELESCASSKLKLTKDKGPSVSLNKKINKLNLETILNDYYQLIPKDIHNFSRHIVSYMDDSSNLLCSFDNEVFKIVKNKKSFTVETEEGNFECKKILLSAGRAGWRWVNGVYNSFGLIEENSVVKYGLKIEMDASCLKDFHNSHCIIRNNDLEVGPFSWDGTMIPEDHLDFAIASFRSNESRWKSEKVCFNVLGVKSMEGEGYQQADRMGRLTFIITNDRVSKEKVSSFMNGKSKISIMPEYNFLKSELEKISTFIPEFFEKAYFYSPVVSPNIAKINLGNDFSTEVKGLYCAGEAAGIPGILGALVSGWIAADGVANG